MTCQGVPSICVQCTDGYTINAVDNTLCGALKTMISLYIMGFTQGEDIHSFWVDTFWLCTSGQTTDESIEHSHSCSYPNYTFCQVYLHITIHS